MYRILEERKNQPINGLKRIPCFRIGIALFEGFKSKELKVEFFSEGRVSEKDITKWFYVETSQSCLAVRFTAKNGGYSGNPIVSVPFPEVQNRKRLRTV